VRGPPAKAAFDASGAPTKALEGFCRKAGVPVESVTREADAKGVEYCYVEVKDAGKSAVEVSSSCMSVFHCDICVQTALQFFVGWVWCSSSKGG
jgi:glycyl-tRNA synthetase beta subunit